MFSGAHSPCDIYQMLAEYYSLSDYTFDSFDEDLLHLQKLLKLPRDKVEDSLISFLVDRPSFDVNQKVVRPSVRLFSPPQPLPG